MTDEDDSKIVLIICLRNGAIPAELMNQFPSQPGVCELCGEDIVVADHDAAKWKDHPEVHFLCLQCAAERAPNATISPPAPDDVAALLAAGISVENIEDTSKIPLREMRFGGD